MPAPEPPAENLPAGKTSLACDLVLPTLLFAALGGMTWAVRGCSGFGATPGCIFAGVTWGAAWWFIARDPGRGQSRRYASGWIILALTFGIGIAGARGWMQWPAFFEGRLMTNFPKGAYEPIDRAYGFVWLFIAGVPWAGLGACLLAWCGSLRETRVWHWVIRIACGLGGAYLALYLFRTFPQYFLPLYESLEERYKASTLKGLDPNLRRLINDNGSALFHLGLYLGFLLYEAARREGKNVVLILTVGIVNGAGWALCQNWTWARGQWPEGRFNWWRCWESSGGISIGIAYGIAYFLVNRPMSARERAALAARRPIVEPSFEWLLVYLGLTSLLAVFVRAQFGGWDRLYFGIVLAFGAAYYLWHRQPAGSARAGSALFAVVLTAALIAMLFAPPSRRGESLLANPFPVGAGAVMAFGIVYYFLRRTDLDAESGPADRGAGDPNLERFGLYVGLLAGLGLSVRNGLKGWCNIYRDDEAYWSKFLWDKLGPVYLICLIAIAGVILFRLLPRRLRGRAFPEAYALMWLVLLVQNTIAQLITGPLNQWTEVAFSIYYLLLFAITAVIVLFYHTVNSLAPAEGSPSSPDGWHAEPAAREPGSPAIRTVG
jgi:hypothetical protein